MGEITKDEGYQEIKKNSRELSAFSNQINTPNAYWPTRFASQLAQIDQLKEQACITSLLLQSFSSHFPLDGIIRFVHLQYDKLLGLQKDPKKKYNRNIKI